MDLAGGHPCQNDLAGTVKNILALIEKPERMNWRIGIAISVFENEILSMVKLFFIFLQLMGGMAIFKKVDDLPVGGMGIVIDMASASS